MSAACVGSGGEIERLMSSVDCRIALYVEDAYERLFGAGGPFGGVIVGALTIYVALFGWRLLSGGGGVTASSLTRRFVAVGFVLALAGNWPTYQRLFVDGLSGGAAEIGGWMAGAAGAAPQAAGGVPADLDRLVGTIVDAASGQRREPAATSPASAPAATSLAPAPVPPGAGGASILWASALAIGLSSAGVIVVSKVSLGLLLALGPLFFMLGLFAATRGLLEGWLRAVVAASLAIALTLALTAAALPLLDPLAQNVADAQRLGEPFARDAFTLAIAAAIFALLSRQILAQCARIVSAWRLPQAAAAPRAADAPATPAPALSGRVAEIVTAASISNGSFVHGSRVSTLAPAWAPGAFASAGPDASTGARSVSRAYRGLGAQARPSDRGRL